jgi:hypothetical protein
MRFNPDQLSLEQLLNFDLLHNHQIGESTPIYVRATNEKK